MNKILLNPGPTNTLEIVKNTQTEYSDTCHRTDEFQELLSLTKKNILRRFSLQALSSEWNVSVFGGSGTSAMEALISSLLASTNIIVAGKYGQRAANIMNIYGVASTQYLATSIADVNSIELSQTSPNLYFVENETTTGEKFSLNKITQIFPNRRLYIDATSAFGATDYSDYLKHIDAISFCSNKCLQSTPGLGIVIWKKSLQTYQRNYYLDLRKYSSSVMPFTVPVQSIAALNCALEESYISEEEMDRRRDDLIDDLSALGIECVNYEPCNSIIGFVHPSKNYEELRDFLKIRGIIIYDGISDIEKSFRVATMSVEFDRYYDFIVRSFNDSCVH